MDKVINNQMTKKAPRRQSHWSLFQIPDMWQEHWSDWSPRGPCSAEEGHCLWNEWLFCIPLLTQRAALWYTGAPSTAPKCCSDNRLSPSLLCCSHLHLHTQVLSHSLLLHCEKGAGPLLWLGYQSTVRGRCSGSSTALSSHSVFYGLLQVGPRCLRKQKEAPTEFPHVLSGSPSN